VHLIVQDNGTGKINSPATLTVQLTNVNEATVINNQAFSVAENSDNGTTVGTVITSGNTCGAFAINASTGIFTLPIQQH
jgi:hypothetical protein